MQERRQAGTVAPLPGQLRQSAREQLENEVRLIRSWLKDLEGTREDNAEALSARRRYHDMLRSREDLLEALQE